MGSLITLFGLAFLAATFLPAQSEAFLTFLLLKSQHAPWLLLTIASVGNVLGSCMNYGLGHYLERFKEKSWFPVKAQTLEKGKIHYRRYGRWSLLLSWVPFIGDPLTVAAGVLKERFVVFLILVAIGKVGRYAVLAWLVLASQP